MFYLHSFIANLIVPLFGMGVDWLIGCRNIAVLYVEVKHRLEIINPFTPGRAIWPSSIH